MRSNKLTTIALVALVIVTAAFFGCDNRVFVADSFEIVSLTAPDVVYSGVDAEIQALVVNKANGVPAPSQTVTFKVNRGIIQATAVTNEFGVAKATFSHTMTDTLLVIAEVEATIHKDVKKVSIRLKRYAGEYEIRKLTASPDTIYADNNATVSRIRALIINKEDGVGSQGIQVRFKSDVGKITSVAVTDSAGIATARFSDNGDGPAVGQEFLTANITAMVGPEEAKTQVFIKDPIREKITISALPRLIYADNNVSFSTVRAKVVDKDGFPIANKLVRFKVEPVGEIQTTVYTDEFGVAQTRLYDGGESSDQPVTITAQADNVKATTTVTIAPVPPVHRVVLDPILDIIALEQVIVLRATAYDVDGNSVVDGTLMQFDANLGVFEESEAEQGGNKFGYTVNGRVSVIWNSGTRAGNVTFYVSCAGKDTTDVAHISPGVPARILMTPQMRAPGAGQQWGPLPVEGLNINDHASHAVRVRTRVLDLYDNPVIVGIPIRFETDLGAITPIKATNAEGEVYADFYMGTSAGDATIIARTLDEEVQGVAVIRIVSDDMLSISFAEQDEVFLNVRGTGGTESRILEVHLRDVHNNLVSGQHWLTYTIVNYPRGLPDLPGDRPNINGVGLSADVRSDNGIARASIVSGKVAGTVTVKVTSDVDGTTIEATKSNIVIRSGPPATVRAFLGDFDTGTNVGGGMWRAQAGAVVTDRWGNEVINGTTVHFSLGQTPPPPRDTSINAAGYVGNPSDDNEDGDPGVAYTHLFYHGRETNQEITIIAESGGIRNTDTEVAFFKLPLQQPNLEVHSNPQHVVFGPGPSPMVTTPPFREVEIIGVLSDGQGTPIANSKILLRTSHGQLRYHPRAVPPPHPNPDSPEYQPEYIYTLPGGIGLPPFGTRGQAYAMLRIYGWICPMPVDEWFTMVDVQVTAVLPGTDTIAQTQVSAYRYLMAIPPGR